MLDKSSLITSINMELDPKYDLNIQKEDIIQAVKTYLNVDEVQLNNFKLQPLSERIGFLGDHAILHVTIYNSTENISFFVKFFPHLKAVADFAEGIGAFKKEMFVYELFKKFKLNNIDLITTCTPICFVKQLNNYFIFENLGLTGFKPLNKHQILDYDMVAVLLKSLAKLHASSLIYEEKQSEQLGRSYRLGEEFSDELEESFFNDREGFANTEGVAACINCIKKEIEIFGLPLQLLSGQNFQQVAEKACKQIYQLVKPSKAYRNVLCHGDLWATNFMVSYDPNTNQPKDCKFVDFQCGRYVPPAQDVFALIHLTTSRDFRKKYMYQMIGLYYSFLEKFLKSAGYTDVNRILSFDDFLKSCEERKLFGILQAAFHFPLILVDNQAVEEYFSDEDLNRRALFEDRSLIVLRYMDKDENYSKRIKESLEDLKEYCDFVDYTNYNK